MDDDLKISIKVGAVISNETTEDLEVLPHKSAEEDGIGIDIVLSTKFAEWLLQIDFDLESPFGMQDLSCLLERFQRGESGGL